MRANTYTGLTTVSAGVLSIQKAQALGGTTTGTTVTGGATLQIQGGITTAAEPLTLNGGGDNSTNGALESVSGANTYAGLITLGSSARINNDDAVNAFTISNGGTITGTGDLTVGGAGNTTIASSIGTTGGFIKDGAGTVTLTGSSLTYPGQTIIKAGTLMAVGAGGQPLFTGNGLDIQGGQAVWDFTGVTTPGAVDPVVEYEVQQSYLNNWAIDLTHPAGSTTANADYLANGSSATHALGWTDTVVGGHNLLTVMYTLYGDTDLNGTVNGADLNTLLSNYQQTGVYWAQGDFDYNGTVNGADLNILLSNYQQHLSVGAAVPEPSTLLLAAAGLLGLLAYAWRKRS